MQVHHHGRALVVLGFCVLADAYVMPWAAPELGPNRRWPLWVGPRMCSKDDRGAGAGAANGSAGAGRAGKVERKSNLLFDDFAAALPRLDGKTVAITGCTSGIGFVVAKTALRLGATLVMLNRPSLRAATALQALRDEIDYKLPQLDSEETADIEARVAQQMAEMRVVQIPCDLLSFSSVRDAYIELRTKFPDGIDVLCLNGGIGASPPEYEGNGFEPMMQTNHLSHFLLVQLLLSSMEQRAAAVGEARIISMTSEARKSPPTPLDPSALEQVVRQSLPQTISAA
jgi:short-subunit dehydrogenase